MATGIPGLTIVDRSTVKRPSSSIDVGAMDRRRNLKSDWPAPAHVQDTLGQDTLVMK